MMENLLQNTISNVFNKIEKYLPNGWQKCCFYAAYTVGGYTMKFYVKNVEGKYIDCFNLGVDENDLTFLFIDIDDIIFPQREALDEKNKWSVLSIFVNADGKASANLDYTDISENTIGYQRDWEQKYLVQIIK